MIYSLWTSPDMAALAFPGIEKVPGQHGGDFQCTVALMEP